MRTADTSGGDPDPDRSSGRLEGLQRHRRIVLGLALGVPISLVLGVLAFRGTDPAEVADVLRAADPWRIALAVGAFGVMYTLQAARWRVVARTPSVPLRTFGGMVVGGIAVNNVLPGRIGDVLRARWLGLEARLPFGRALATVVLDRAGDVIALTVLLGASAWGIDGAPWLRRIVLGAAAAVVLVICGVLVARAYTVRRPRARHGRGLARAFARDTLDGLADPLGHRRIAVALGLSFTAWTVFAVAAMLVARAVGFELGLGQAIFVTSVVNLGVAIPSSPGFVGTYQWLAVQSLAALDVATREQALAFSLALHAAWYVPTTLIGGIAVLFRVARRRSDVTSASGTRGYDRPRA